VAAAGKPPSTHYQSSGLVEHLNLPSRRRLGQGVKLHPSWWGSHHHAVQGVFTMTGRHRVVRRLSTVYWGTTLNCILPTPSIVHWGTTLNCLLPNRQAQECQTSRHRSAKPAGTAQCQTTRHRSAKLTARRGLGKAVLDGKLYSVGGYVRALHLPTWLTGTTWPRNRGRLWRR